MVWLIFKQILTKLDLFNNYFGVIDYEYYSFIPERIKRNNMNN